MPQKTIVVDVRTEEPFGGSYVPSPLLYPFLKEGSLAFIEQPGGYRHTRSLRSIRHRIQSILQRGSVASGDWLLCIQLDQISAGTDLHSHDPSVGTVAHQMLAFRKYVLEPLREGMVGQEPKLVLGLREDEWEWFNGANHWHPVDPFAYCQWSLDRFGMLRLDPTSESSYRTLKANVEEVADMYPFLGCTSGVGDDPAGISTRDWLEAHVDDAVPVPGISDDAETVPPTRCRETAIAVQDAVLELRDGNITPSSIQEAFRRHRSVGNRDTTELRGDFALLRLPLRGERTRRQTASLKREYLIGALALEDVKDLKETLRSSKDECFAYWLGDTTQPHRICNVNVCEESVQEALNIHRFNLTRLKDALSHSSESVRVPLIDINERMASCDAPKIDNVSEPFHIPLVRSIPNPLQRWTTWTNDVDATLDENNDRVHRAVGACLRKQRDALDSAHPSKKEVVDLDEEIQRLRGEYHKRREEAFRDAVPVFKNDWQEQASSHKDAVRQALERRPTSTQQHLAIATLGLLVFVLLAVSLVPFPGSASGGIGSVLLWALASAVCATGGILSAHQRLRTMLRKACAPVNRTAKNLLAGLRSYAERKQQKVEKYFGVLVARENLRHAQRVKHALDQDRKKRTYHRGALKDHREQADALARAHNGRTTEPPGNGSRSSPKAGTDWINRAPEQHPDQQYAYLSEEEHEFSLFGKKTKTHRLPGLETVKRRVDPSYPNERGS